MNDNNIQKQPVVTVQKSSSKAWSKYKKDINITNNNNNNNNNNF